MSLYFKTTPGRPAPNMRPPSWTPRERIALQVADRVVARRLLPRGPGGVLRLWGEEVFPAGAEGIRHCLERVRYALTKIPNSDSILLYVGGEYQGEIVLAQVSRSPGAETPLGYEL